MVDEKPVQKTFSHGVGMEIKDLPRDWSSDNKVWSFKDDRRIVLFHYREVSLSNYWGFLAICDADKVLYTSKKPAYTRMTSPITLDERFLFVQSQGDGWELHIFDCEAMSMAIIPVNSHRYIADHSVEIRDGEFFFAGTMYEKSALYWTKIRSSGLFEAPV